MFKPAIVWLFRGLLCLAIITTAHAFARHCCVKLPAHKGQQKCCKVEQNWNSTRDVCCDNNSTAKKIHLAAFVPMMHYNKYYSFKHAMLLAMDIINNRTDILPDYELVMHFGDTVSGQPDRALYCLFQWLYTEPVKHMIIGPAFTRALQPVVTAISQWNILGLAYASVSQHLTGFVYRNMYRMVPSTYSFNLAKIAFLKKFKWKRVAIIHGYDDKVFSPTVRHLQTLLDKNNISTIAVEGFQEFLDDVDLRFQIAKFKSLDARIIIGEFSDQGAKHVFCEVYKQKLYGPKYVWFLFGLLSPHIAIKLRSEEFRKLTCTREQLKEVIQGMFGIRSVQLRTDNVTTYSGLNADEYLELMKERAPYVKNSNISTYAFDSVFMAARAFSRVSKTSTPADNFTYKSRSHLKALNKILMADSFEGVSGPLRFNKKKDRFGTVSISQIHNESWKLIGQHFTFDDKLELDDASSIWPGGHVPKDQMIRKEKLLMNDITLIVVIWLLAIIGILLSLAFLYFNIAYRDNRLIKMSSPQLNNLIILGCLLCYVSTILFGLDARFLSFYTYGFNCNARTAVMSIGFSLAFGAMFSKTWRVHKIFTAAKTLKKMVKMAIKDIHLFGIVAVLVVIDTFYLSLWFGYDPLKATKLNFTLQEETINDVIYVPVLYQCTCQYKTYFIAAMYAYKGILLLFGLFLAWETRNVTIPALNDSKYIGMSVYNVVTLSLIGAIVTTALDNTIHYEAPYAISSLCLIICTTATLLLVFVPKVYSFILGSEEQTFNTTTINNGVSSMGRSHGSHAFRFESESSAKPKHFSTKGVQTNHQELTASSDIGYDTWL